MVIDTIIYYGWIDHMKAMTERQHALKYSLFYGRNGRRLAGYDNERGKGDHKHIGAVETSYKFVSIEQLMADFLADVERINNEHDE